MHALLALEIEFSAAVTAGASRAELFIRLSQLVEVFQSHFDTEEVSMQLNGFPGLKLHAEEHRKLIRQIGYLRDDIGTGVISRCDALALFVRLWTEQHMAGLDLHYQDFLREKDAWCAPSPVCMVQ